MNETNWLGINDYQEFDAVYFYDRKEGFRMTEAVKEYLKKFKANGGKFATFKNLDILHAYNPQTGMYEECEMQLEARINEMLENITRKTKVNEFIWQVKRQSFINKEIDECTAPVEKILLENGIYDFKKKELEPFNPEIFFFSRIPVKYDPEAKCPRITEFINSLFDEDEKGKKDAKAIRELAGYLLYRKYTIHKAFFFQGGGSNGKSTIQEMFIRFIGKENVIAIPLQIVGERFTLARFINKHANIVSDLPQGKVLEAGYFRQLTDGTQIEGEVKNIQKTFLFSSFAKMIFSANVLPKLPDQTIGTARRLRVIVFGKKFPPKPGFIESICTPEEFSGLLNIALVELEELLKNGSFSGDLSAEESLKEYAIRSDSITAYAHEALEEDATAEPVLSSELYNSYLDYCRFKRLVPETDQMFFKNIPKKIGTRTVKKGKERAYSNIIILKGVFEEKTDNTNNTIHLYTENIVKNIVGIGVNAVIPVSSKDIIFIIREKMGIRNYLNRFELLEISGRDELTASIIENLTKKGDLIEQVFGQITFSSSVWRELDQKVN